MSSEEQWGRYRGTGDRNKERRHTVAGAPIEEQQRIGAQTQREQNFIRLHSPSAKP